jgi:hypothetical protein
MVKYRKAQIRQLKTALRWKIPAAHWQRMQMVLLRESGMTQPAIAAAIGVSLGEAAHEQAIGHQTSNSMIHNLLVRHGWRKLIPRRFIPQRDIAAQNAFKKTVFQML